MPSDKRHVVFNPETGLSQKGLTVHPTLLKAFKPPQLLRQEANLYEAPTNVEAKDPQCDLNKKEGQDVDVH